MSGYCAISRSNTGFDTRASVLSRSATDRTGMRPPGQQPDLADAFAGAHLDRSSLAGAASGPATMLNRPDSTMKNRVGRVALGIEHGAARQAEPFEFGGDRGALDVIERGEQRHRAKPRREARQRLPAAVAFGHAR